MNKGRDLVMTVKSPEPREWQHDTLHHSYKSRAFEEGYDVANKMLLVCGLLCARTGFLVSARVIRQILTLHQVLRFCA
eukprot:1389380-Pleurochrysis_carterae.AAC.1